MASSSGEVILRYTLLLLALTAYAAIAPVCQASVITVCQCNILGGGVGSGDYSIANGFAQWVATINPQGSSYPPIAVVGMQELMNETDRSTIQGLLENHTGVAWTSQRVAQGVNSTSGIGWFWRPDLVETQSDWYLGEKTLETIDNGYFVKFAGRLFKKAGVSEAFGLFTGKLLWDDAILNGHAVTEEERRQEAVRLKTWITNGEAGSPGMSGFPGTVRVITCDLNTDYGNPAWNEMNLEFADPGTQHTANSASSPDWLLDITGRRIDYVWWDYDSGAKQSGGFADGSRRSSYFGSDHRAVYATVNLHTVDLTPPSVAITSPEAGSTVSGATRVSASASDASGILQVQFSIDGVPVWTDTAAPYEFDWDPAGYTQDYHTITAVATDGSTNRLKGSAAPVLVWVGPAGSEPTIANAKSKIDLSPVSLSGKIVTASFSGYFYIEEPNRSAGIKVAASPSPSVGTVVDVAGTINTLNSERQIAATSVVQHGSEVTPAPLGVTNASLGGGPMGQYVPGIYGAKGLNNIGMLVSCWGKVKGIVSGFYMYIDDGSKLRDGYTGGYYGVRVDISGLSGYTPPSVGSYVKVTGISTTSMISGKAQRRVKVRSASDIRVEN